MLRINNIKMKPKMIGLFLIVGLVPLALVGWQATRTAKKALMDSAFAQLEGVREIKKTQVEDFFVTRKNDMVVLKETVSSMRNTAYANLNSVRDARKESVERYFNTIDSQMITFSQDQMVIDAMSSFNEKFHGFRAENEIDNTDIIRMRKELSSYYTDEYGVEYAAQNGGNTVDTISLLTALDDDAVALQYHYIQANSNALGSKHVLDSAADGSTYSALHNDVHPIVRTYLEEFGYYDIFLVDIDTGDIVYSVFKELDYGTSLLDGPYADTNFADAFRMAKDSDDPSATFFVDYKTYTPSYDGAAGFIASPIFDGDKKVGVAIFQMPLDRIQEIMGSRAGLGETGETILVGPDFQMRSDSFRDPENHSVQASFRNPDTGKVDTKATRAVHENGETGTLGGMKDYSGNRVLISYTPVDILGVTWCLNAKMDVYEAYVPKSTDGSDFYEQYTKLYGYYDLFLMTPDGYCFYSAFKEPDFQTNLVDGVYKDSGLGKLTRQVLETKDFGIIDFEPYAPSNGAPASFIADPIVVDGEPVMVVALQLSLDAINAIMTSSEGMGETGETILVGPDYLMRSDSRREPENHTVIASFSNPELGKVDTPATRGAIEEKKVDSIFGMKDYIGNEVMIAHTPVDILGAFTWCLNAKMDMDEVQQPAKALNMTILIIGGIISIIVAAIAFFIALTLAAPLVKGVTFAQAVANGDLTQQSDVDQKDEVGILASALNKMAENLRGMMQKVSSNSTTLSASSEQMNSTAVAMTNRAENMNELANTAASATEQASANIKNVAAGIEEVSANSNSVASASEQISQNLVTVGAAVEEMSANMNTIASNTENMSGSVNTVASAVEEMSSSLNDVSRNTEDAATIVDRASKMADNSARTVNTLGDSAKEIDKVVDIITGIASQTNLLALNATIEAASAGEAGKGFAVVANEVKELAKQTAAATDDIRNQVESMQGNTQEAVTAISEIVNVIGQVNETFTTIATSVQQQTNAVNEISQSVGEAAQGAQVITSNVQEAAKGAQEVSQNVQEATTGVNDIAKGIGELAVGANEISRNAAEASQGMNEVANVVEKVNIAAVETKDEASELNTASGQCSELAVQLQDLVGHFTV